MREILFKSGDTCKEIVGDKEVAAKDYWWSGPLLADRYFK